MGELSKESRDVFLDAFLKLGMFLWAWRLVAPEEIVQYTIANQAMWLWWLLKSFSFLVTITYFILTFYALKYFRRQKFEKRTFRTSYVYLWMVAIFLALSLLGVMDAVVPDKVLFPTFPAWANALLVVAINGIYAYLLFFGIYLRKKLNAKRNVTGPANKTVCLIIGALAAGAIAFMITRINGGSHIEGSALSYGVTFAAFVVELAAVWYSVRRMKALRSVVK